MRLVHGLIGLIAVVAAFALSAPASAQIKKLKVGDNAPALVIADWFNGSPTIIEQDKIYVVEFWATWCGPCKKSIPHLNAMHNELASKGVTIIGVSNEESGLVRSFVDAKGPSMAYLVGVDDSQQTTQAWMEAAGQEGIPCAFVVGKDRKIAYIGHPLDETFEQTVRGLATGTFDPGSDRKAAPTIEAARKAAKLKNFRDAYTHYDNAIAVNPKHFAALAREKYKVMLLQEKNTKGAAEFGASMLKTYSDSGEVLGDFAVMIVTDPELKDVKDVDLAKAAAATMVKVSGRSSAGVLDRLATVQFNTGKVDEAVETQTEAWMTASPGEKATYKQKLDLYRAALGRAQAGLQKKN
ncbi:MAG: TlpA disulfide reductase family protein [Phycisphaerae bacterium]|nr:TlpA disulfide reductase family protein [Phycisphaerae bacterium]